MVRFIGTLKTNHGKELIMFSRSWLTKKEEQAPAIRTWNIGDIPRIMHLASQNPENGWMYEYEEWRARIEDTCNYGIVIEEDYVVRGCAMIFVTKNPRAHINLFQVDMHYRRQGYGTRMMYHLFSKIREWNKALCFDVKDVDRDLHLFLASPNISFVPTEIHEFRGECGERDSAIYTMEYPPPWGHCKGTILIRKDNKETTKSFPQTPDPA